MFNILVVEDNIDMQELLCTVLSDSGFRCFCAGQEFPAKRELSLVLLF